MWILSSWFCLLPILFSQFSLIFVYARLYFLVSLAQRLLTVALVGIRWSIRWWLVF